MITETVVKVENKRMKESRPNIKTFFTYYDCKFIIHKFCFRSCGFFMNSSNHHTPKHNQTGQENGVEKTRNY